jgi:hypothetical protein
MEVQRGFAFVIRRSKPRYPTDKELAAALKRAMVAVRESIADFKEAAPGLVQSR